MQSCVVFQNEHTMHFKTGLLKHTQNARPYCKFTRGKLKARTEKYDNFACLCVEGIIFD